LVFALSRKFTWVLNICGELIMACMLTMFTVLFVVNAEKALDASTFDING
jgi:hypothetical protein